MYSRLANIILWPNYEHKCTNYERAMPFLSFATPYIQYQRGRDGGNFWRIMMIHLDDLGSNNVREPNADSKRETLSYSQPRKHVPEYATGNLCGRCMFRRKVRKKPIYSQPHEYLTLQASWCDSEVDQGDPRTQVWREASSWVPRDQ